MGGYQPRVIEPVVIGTVNEGGPHIETIAAELTGVSTPGPNATIEIHGYLVVAPSTGATDVWVHVRRGGITGPFIGQGATMPVVAGSTYALSLDVVDEPGDVDNETYVLTFYFDSETVAGQVYGGLFSGVIH